MKNLLGLQQCYYETKIGSGQWSWKYCLSLFLTYMSCLIQILLGLITIILRFSAEYRFCIQQKSNSQTKEIRKDCEGVQIVNDWEASDRARISLDDQMNNLRGRVDFLDDKCEYLNQTTNQLTLDYCTKTGNGFIVVPEGNMEKCSFHKQTRRAVEIKTQGRDQNQCFNISEEDGKKRWKQFVSELQREKTREKPLTYADIVRCDAQGNRFKRVFIPKRGWMSVKRLEIEEQQYGRKANVQHVKSTEE